MQETSLTLDKKCNISWNRSSRKLPSDPLAWPSWLRWWLISLGIRRNIGKTYMLDEMSCICLLAFLSNGTSAYVYRSRAYIYNYVEMHLPIMHV